jgi:hypothetical protein
MTSSTIPNAIRGRTRIPGLVDSKALSSFSPLNISNLKMWLSASNITNLNDGDAITTWYDFSTNGNNAIQNTADNKPVYKISIINYLPVVRFTTNDAMIISGMDAGSNITLSIVYKPTLVTHIGLFDSAHNQANTFRQNIAGRWEWHNTSPEFDLNLLNTEPVVTTLVATLAPSRSITYYRNGTNINTYTHASTTGITWGDPYIGSINVNASYYNGDIAEIILIGRAISTDEAIALHNYLNEKYNLW